MASVWVFGYGSLLWKTEFPYEDKVVGYVRGYTRRFWQGSIVHRGTPNAPGRVVTLVPKEEDCTWGIAYKVHPKDIPDVMAYLNKRETSSYATHKVSFYPREKQMPSFTVLVYIGTETHPNYLGPAPITGLVDQVMKSRGHSGCNADYVLQLAKVTREITPDVQDEHLFSLESKLRERMFKESSSSELVCRDDDCMYKCLMEEMLLQNPGMTEGGEQEREEMA